MSLSEYFMNLALAEGRRALPGCLPNPPVGCVLVKAGEVIARGHTQPPGQPHAEALALSCLPPGITGLTAYVTLEPCSFHGRTPSCAQALVRHGGIEQVYVAILDPDPRNAGAGVRILLEAGIEVFIGLGAQQAQHDLGRYLLEQRHLV
ncbi:bifunctional diaminohydroxyphosphoribosylaminopyrimidine deaminase/5-amino-6-(5-phosphoribosylamino)uracil reductase RibD [Pseudomonas sp. LRF_L74]|uniref:bifunctional diaminohydroxyphosphoribosylaminopyrimidine deaminase/5-amino-6-(5-phosphoribosylamino)uracil reductase RibD n=1 Tax=Pseudomonas sp. LRF_L74 TaxID=3369422 RepID=UPI003F647B4E